MMNRNKKGGALSVYQNLNLDDIFHWVRNIRFLNIKSVGGFMFEVEIEENEQFISIYPGLTKGDKISYTKYLLLKVIQIGNEHMGINKENFRTQIKEIITEEDFLNEVELQKYIHDKSIDKNYEPICPNIIAHGFLDKEIDENKSDPYFFYGNALLKKLVKACFKNKNVSKLGFFFMESLGGDAMSIKEAFPQITYDNPITEGSRTNKQNAILKNYTYQLLRLAKLGIVHNDTHLGNALYYENYDYIDNYRVVLIDFGRSKTGLNVRKTYDYNVISNTFPNYKNKNLGYWSYRELNDYIKNIGGNSKQLRIWFQTIEENEIKESQKRFQEYLIQSGNNEKLQQFFIDFNHTNLLST
jgi:hypothetical protein